VLQTSNLQTACFFPSCGDSAAEYSPQCPGNFSQMHVGLIFTFPSSLIFCHRLFPNLSIKYYSKIRRIARDYEPMIVWILASVHSADRKKNRLVFGEKKVLPPPGIRWCRCEHCAGRPDPSGPGLGSDPLESRVVAWRCGLACRVQTMPLRYCASGRCFLFHHKFCSGSQCAAFCI